MRSRWHGHAHAAPSQSPLFALQALALLEVASDFQNAYLAASLARMSDAVTTAFPGEQAGWSRAGPAVLPLVGSWPGLVQTGRLF